MDLLAAAYIVDDIAGWENTTGDGTARIKHIIEEGNLYTDGPSSVHAADLQVGCRLPPSA